jgi:U3 small nucleolar RNA-associated protein 21
MHFINAKSHLQTDEALFAHLKVLSPSAVDLELRLLITLHQQNAFLHALIQRIISHKDFEMVQTLMTVFLRLYGESLVENAELRDSMEELLRVSKLENERLRLLMSRSLGMLGFVREVG